MTTEEKIRDILHRHMMEHYFKDEDLVNEFKAIIREEKIKLLEGLKYEEARCKDLPYHDELTNAVYFDRRVLNSCIDLIISQLREEGKEKGKV